MSEQVETVSARPVEDETLYLLKSEELVNLTNCDREPIHTINHIKPDGALLVFNPDDLTIVQASENTSTLFGRAALDLIGQSAEGIFAPAQLEELRKNTLEGNLDSGPLYLFTSPIDGQGLFYVVAHIYRGLLLVEIEPTLSDDVASNYYRLIHKTLARFEEAATVKAFAQIVCEEVRRINGFDRVMVYKFLKDDSGEVIAESIAPEIREQWEPLLGLRYPASDIPKQARALFILNPLRLIPDAGYVPCPLVPAVSTLTGKPCDMSYAFLRGVSPMHVEYMRNMGVSASMSLAILKNGALWGLIACHHHAPHRVPYDVRTACEFLARVVSLQVTGKEINEQGEYRRQIEETNQSLLQNIARKHTLISALLDCNPNVTTLIECGGCAVLLGGECYLSGNTPDESQVRALAEWLTTNHNDSHAEKIYATETLAAVYENARAFQVTACGLLALRIAYGGGGYLLWFRPEVIQTVQWAGDPVKQRQPGSENQITPRNSFALWQETVRNTASEWQPIEIEAVRRLHVSVIEAMARFAEELAQANERLFKSNEELDSFAYIASHDLKEPLRGIHNFSNFLKEDYGDLLPEEGQGHLKTVLKLSRRMEALIDSLLHYSRAGRLEVTSTKCDLNMVLNEVLETSYLRIRETGAEVRIPRPLPSAFCDRTQIAEVFHNLIQNALKYNDRPEKWLEIGFLDSSPKTVNDSITFYVKDNGIGIEADQREVVFHIFRRLHGRDEYGGGYGAGLTIAHKIVGRHEGRMWVESVVGEGSTFYFTLPRDQK